MQSHYGNVLQLLGQLAQLVQSIPISSGGLCQLDQKHIGAISSAGSEHPDFIGRVGVQQDQKHIGALSSAGSEHLVYTEGVGGSNPSLPTKSLEIGTFFIRQHFIICHFSFTFSTVLLKTNFT